jgi:hypothetical protein
MKRSEMLKIIEDLYDNRFNEYPNDVRAENLLATLEEKGMKPPGYKGYKTQPGYAIKGGGKIEENGTFTYLDHNIQEWEPEDE